MSTEQPAPSTPAETEIGGGAVEPGATPASPSSPAGIARARAILRTATLVVGGLSVVMLILIVVLSSLGFGTTDLDVSGAGEPAVWALVFASPVLIVIALNLLTWRALLPGLARRSSGAAITLSAVIALGLAVASILVVFLLLLIGFFAGATIGL
jgi:hypothetical protein